MTRAAERLNVTQSALSHQLREIEDRLRVPLFHRVNRRLLLTEGGRRLLDSARAVLAELERAEADLDALAAGREGVLRISTECYTCYRWLPPIFRAFQERFPNVAVEIAPEFTKDPLRAILSGEVDAAIALTRPEGTDMVWVPIFEDEVLLVTSPDHPFAMRRYIEPREVEGEHLVLHSAPEESFFVRDVLTPAGVRPRAISEMRLTEALLEFVAAGLGVSPLANWVFADALAAEKVSATRVTARGYHREWFAVTLASRERPAYIDEFVDILRTNSAAFLGLPQKRARQRSA